MTLPTSMRVHMFLAAFLLLAGGHQAAAQTPNALARLHSLHLAHLDGAIPTYYSEGTKSLAMRDQAELSACAAWYSSQLNVTPATTLAVLNKADWDRLGGLDGYPMAEAFPEEGDVIFLPDSFQTFPGRDPRVADQELNFIAFHEAGHIFQRATGFVAPDLFMQEYFATMLATAYAQHARPQLITATLHARKHRAARPRYRSFEDLDLVGLGVGFDNYDWLQIQTLRLAIFFVQGQDLGSLVQQMQARFPAGRALTTAQVFAGMDAIRPGFLARAGSLAAPTTLPILTLGKCEVANAKGTGESYVGVWNQTAQPVTLIEDGKPEIAAPGYTIEQNKVGAQFQIPSGRCITYPETPGYIALR